MKNINLGPTFFDNFKIEQLLSLKWRLIFDSPCEHLWKSIQKNIFILMIFLLKLNPCWLTSTKLHHWGHTNRDGHLREIRLNTAKDLLIKSCLWALFMKKAKIIPLIRLKVRISIWRISLADSFKFWTITLKSGRFL